jgi:rhodanese-related sulfurtransferase
MSLVSLSQWQEMAGEGDVVVDVRTPAEFASGHIHGSLNLPLNNCAPESLSDLLTGHSYVDGKVCLTCKTGQRSQMAAQKLQGWAGELLLLDGGVDAIKSGLNVTAQAKVISLERQVFIAAGALVLLGVLLGTFAHSGWYGISAFVGGGLLFSGLTGFCGMALLLAKMPWNNT